MTSATPAHCHAVIRSSSRTIPATKPTTGSDILMDGGVTAAFKFGELAPAAAR